MYGIIGWFGLLDVGLGNGLRNKFAECMANGDKQSATIYISTAYAILSIIMGVTCIVFFAINHYLNWAQIINVPAEKAHELSRVALIIFGFFCMQLVIKLISTILLADHKTAIAGGINTMCSAIGLIIVFILNANTANGQGSLTYLALTVGIVNVIVPIVVSIYFYKTRYKEYKPSIKHVQFSYAKKLVNVGLMFFLFQSTALIVVATDNIIISQLYGPSEVTPYNVALKYFTPISILFNIVSAPLWSAYTEAYTKNEMDWVKKITSKMLRFWTLIVMGTIVMVLAANTVYSIWIKEDIHVSFGVTIFMGVFALLSTFNQIFGNFINGIGKMRLSFYLTIITAIINIPLCFLLAKYCNLGSAGIILASCISLLPDIIFIPIQYLKIINKTATGIWNK
jgi:O-antigen/teichoic acid export membrane protein